MSVRPFFFGSETEFGISCLDPREQNHITNSLRLVSFLPNPASPDCLWDYEGENPLLDLFGNRMDGEREDPDPYANRSLNKPLANGGRLYVDGAHPEYSSPEVTDPLDLVRYESAGEQIADACRKNADRALGQAHFCLHKNNSDGKGNSYGYHENYLVPKSVSVHALMEAIIPFLITRQIFCGAGKVGTENGREKTHYQLSQRADFFETLAELNTMVRRPLFNTRNEPHADPKEWLRLHVIPADSNMSQVSTFLKVGTLALVLRLVEEGALENVPRIKKPVASFGAISHDLTIKKPVAMDNAAPMTAVEIQRIYLEAAKKYADQNPLPGSFPQVLVRWEESLDALEVDPFGLSRTADWAIKYRMIDTYLAAKGLDWSAAQAKAMDLQYHDINPEKGLYHTVRARGMVEELVTQEEISAAMSTPPEDTRAWFRGTCLARFGKAVYGVSWGSVLLHTGEKVSRIPTLNPFRGTKAIAGPLLDSCSTPEELIDKLEQG